MGRKCTWPGKYINICIAFIISFAISGCVASVGDMEAKTAQGDAAPRWRFLKADASQEDQQNKLSSEKASLNDERLFDIGISYADQGNSTKDYNKSIATFKKLVTEHPNSIWVYRGHVLSDILQENTKLKKQGTDLLQENTKLKKQGTDLLQENTKLKEIIEQSKKVDIEIEQKKRE
jgi:hypothetical protein